jgi:hypothetical protein
LPPDFADRVGFVAAIEEHREQQPEMPYEQPRFFGYYFENGAPVGVSGAWTVALEQTEGWTELAEAIERLTEGRFSVNAERGGTAPDYLLVHDRWSGACWLWSFGYGRQFVTATEAILGADSNGRAARGERDGWGWGRG